MPHSPRSTAGDVALAMRSCVRFSSTAGIWSCAEFAAGRPFDLGDEPLRKALDFDVSQRSLLRLQHHGDRQGFFFFRQTSPFIDVEQTDLGDELAVDDAGGAQ